MRITNQEAHPQFFSYASITNGGKTLQPGEASLDIPLVRMFADGLQKDLAAGKIKINLSQDDRKVIDNWFTADKCPLRVKQLPKPVVKRKPVKKVATLKAAPPVLPKPKLPAAHPVTNVPVTPENVKTGQVSLAQLMQQNQSLDPEAKKAKTREIGQFMGSKV